MFLPKSEFAGQLRMTIITFNVALNLLFILNF
jgi:hypothetical protein